MWVALPCLALPCLVWPCSSLSLLMPGLIAEGSCVRRNCLRLHLDAREPCRQKAEQGGAQGIYARWTRKIGGKVQCGDGKHWPSRDLDIHQCPLPMRFLLFADSVGNPQVPSAPYELPEVFRFFAMRQWLAREEAAVDAVNCKSGTTDYRRGGGGGGLSCLLSATNLPWNFAL